MEVEVTGRKIILKVDKEIYNIDVLHKCFYWYGNNFDIEIGSQSDKLYSIILESKSEIEDLNSIVGKIKRDIIDFKLRDIVVKETKTIRELIIAKAFAYYGLDDNPVTEMSDPVGFNPETMQGND